jgi:hypothetical protein
MRRQPRFKAPDTLQHLRAGGIERTTTFPDDTDKADLGARLAVPSGT